MMKSVRLSHRNVLAAAAAALFALAGCQKESAKSPAGQSAKPPSQQAQTAHPPEAHILVDEAQLRKPHAILAGTVENVGGERLEELAVVLELRRRADGSVEQRTVPLHPSALAPGEKGRYSLKVLSDEWSGSKLLRLRSGRREQDVAFKTSPGARRPPERLPESRTITVTKGTTQPRSPGGEEFINTPDTPVSVP